MKATELVTKLQKAIDSKDTSRCVSALVKPSCLIIDEIGRCKFNYECTNLFFDIIDRRYEKETPNTLVLTSNTPVVNWDQFFTGGDTLMCALDRIFDRATVFVMKGASFRGADCETHPIETKPTVVKNR